MPAPETLNLGGIALAEDQARRFRAGGQVGVLHAPLKRGALWVVAVEDAMGERREKTFTTAAKAHDFHTSLWLGMSATEARVLASDGALPGLDRGDPDNPDKRLRPASAHQIDKRHRNTGTGLRRVAEVLDSYGLDPSVELAEVLAPQPVIDELGDQVGTSHRLPPEQRAKVLLELLQYVHPKLRAIDVKVEGTLATMTQEQIDNRLAHLLGQAAGPVTLASTTKETP